ncbi:MAG TPA: metal ABC transporter substrate-binding protein [Polyangiaceae bacterium]|jgi:ABC-type Zn uptake system ZnuABC Zn-binding protein ZnuA|nr:metal ABC transporter substrate-binding protein [Polyangiaceae bacterium]
MIPFWLSFIISVWLGAASARAEPLAVVATLPALGKVAEAVGGDEVRVTTIASGVQDPHFVDPRPSYMVKLRDADALLVNGLDLEVGWVPPLIEGARNGRLRVGAPGYVDCSRNVPLLELPNRQLTRAEGDVHPFGNPHYMTDPLNAKIVADTIAQAFSGLRPQKAAYFAGRAKSFQSSIDKAMFGAELVDMVGGNKLDRLARAGELDAFLSSAQPGAQLGGWLGAMAPLRSAKIVFYHRSYSYFAQRFGLSVVDYVELKPGIQPGPSHLADVVASIRREGVRVVVAHPFNDQKLAELVAQKGGATLLLLPLDVGGVPGAADIPSFFDTVTSALVGALGRR